MPTLELSMIVKNGAASLGRCLESVRGVVDRIAIGDTGSTDNTQQIAREFGASIVSVPWQNDFAAARNAVLAHATCDWIIFLDADEMLDPIAAAEIRSLTSDTNVAAYDLTTWNYVRDAGFRSSGEQAKVNPMQIPEAGSFPAYFPSTNTRIFRRDARIRFDHCVHETVGDCLDTLGLLRRKASLIIHHFGYVEDDEAYRLQKESLYYRLALSKVAGSPSNYQANLGAGIAELDHAKQAGLALPYFDKALVLNPRRAAGWLYAGICLNRLGRHAEALSRVQRAISLDPANILAASTLGDISLQIGDHSRARYAYQRAIQLGDASSLSLAKLGASEVRLGDHVSGMARVQAAIRQSPDSGELYDIYAPTAFLTGDSALACDAAEHRLSMKNVSAFNFLLAATLHLHTNMQEKAHWILKHGASRFPDNIELKTKMASLGLTVTKAVTA